MKHSVIREKKAKASRYVWQRHKELLLGIDDEEHNKKMRYIMQLKNAELIREEIANLIRGYCDKCGCPNTVDKTCMVCGYKNEKPRLTQEEWYKLGVNYQIGKVIYIMQSYGGKIKINQQ